MQLYQFEKIYSQMEKEFGKIRKGEEETYAMLLLPMEGNVLKIHREFPGANSRRLREAIALALFDVKVNYSGEEYDTAAKAAAADVSYLLAVIDKAEFDATTVETASDDAAWRTKLQISTKTKMML